jgi:hypothetical protein
MVLELNGNAESYYVTQAFEARAPRLTGLHQTGSHDQVGDRVERHLAYTAGLIARVLKVDIGHKRSRVIIPLTRSREEIHDGSAQWTASSIVSTLNAEIVRQLHSGPVKAKLEADGSDVVANSAAEFAALMRADYQRCAAVIKEAGVRADD